MKLTSANSTGLQFHPDAYRFVFESLQITQDRLSRPIGRGPDDESAHVSGPELLEGFQKLAKQKFGLMARSVLDFWGIHETADVGRLVFELIERGEMRKTDEDRVEDFFGLYDFQVAFDTGYEIPTENAFQ